jgi:methylmalonyl-CoA mutase
MTRHESPVWDMGDLFPRRDDAQWRQIALAALKGAPFERLISSTYDGIAIQPLYLQAQDEAPRSLRQMRGPWASLARLDHADADQAHVQALEDLDGGAQGLHLVFRDASVAYGFGLSPDKNDIAYVLEDVYLDKLPLSLDIGPHVASISSAIIELAQKKKYALDTLNLCFGIDPFAYATTSGTAPRNGYIDEAIGCGVDLARQGIQSPIFAADGRIAHNAGASEAQELACVLAQAVAVLRTLDSRAVDVKRARTMLELRLSADADQFLSMAKMRAMRRLWARVEASCGLNPQAVRLHADTAWRMMTQRDPWVNLLRTTMATFAAGLGGADTMSVLPFTQALGLPDGFARRLARNTQSILLLESNLARVDDPSAGAGGIEALTHELCMSGWDIFQKIEKHGGYSAALQSGFIADMMKASAETRARRIACRTDTLTGTSDFPHINENPVEVLEIATRTLHAPAANALAPLRVAEPFEDLRNRADAYRARCGHRPRVFLANFGPVSAFTARATFAKNFFEAGGIEAIMSDGCDEPATLARAAQQADAEFICLCSSDALYAETAPALITALATLNAQGLYIAGRLKAQESELRALGAHDFIFAGCDALALLKQAHERLARI